MTHLASDFSHCFADCWPFFVYVASLTLGGRMLWQAYRKTQKGER